MDGLHELGDCSAELSQAIQTLTSLCRDACVGSSDTLPFLLQRPSLLDATTTKRSILKLSSQIQALLMDPNDFIQCLSTQWLAEFQVLAYIPLAGHVPAKDIAELVGVPEAHLRRVVRLVASAGFLAEPQPGLLAHTAISAAFVTNATYLDAVRFLAQTAVPAASHMAAAELQHQNSHGGHGGHSYSASSSSGRSGSASSSSSLMSDDVASSVRHARKSAYSLAFNSAGDFQSACEQRSKLLRQYKAYLRCMGDVDDKTDDEDAVELLLQLDWRTLGQGRIVIANGSSTRVADALSARYPALQFTIQTPDPALDSAAAAAAVTVSTRAPGGVQPIDDAAVYILQLPQASLAQRQSDAALDAEIQAELRAHIRVLRSNQAAMLILMPRLLPEPGALDPDVEAVARLRDLSRLQLADERSWDLDEFIGVVNAIRDDRGGQLVVVNQLTLSRTTMVALGLKYQERKEGV